MRTGAQTVALRAKGLHFELLGRVSKTTGARLLSPVEVGGRHHRVSPGAAREQPRARTNLAVVPRASVGHLEADLGPRIAARVDEVVE